MKQNISPTGLTVGVPNANISYYEKHFFLLSLAFHARKKEDASEYKKHLNLI